MSAVRVAIVGSIVAGVGCVGLGIHAAAGFQSDLGVGISAAPITLAEPAQVGQSYEVGPVTVVNTGNAAGIVHLRVADEPGSSTQPVPAAWVRFERDRVPLAGGEQDAVAVHVAVPADAPAGDYQSLVVASIAAEASPGASGLAAEAATRLTFAVSAAPAATDGSGQEVAGRVMVLGVVVFVVGAVCSVVTRVIRRRAATRRHLVTNR